MTAVDRSSRQKMIAGAADMIRRRGLNATSIREVAKHAGTPLGSTYHYFPGGKQELAVEAVRFAGDAVAGMLEGTLRAGPVEGLRTFLGLWRHILVDTDFRAGCPVLAASIEEPAGDEPDAVLAVAAAAFEGWRDQLVRSLIAHGCAEAAAGQLATLIVASVEGALVMCRACRNTKPIDDIAAQLEPMIAAAVGH